MPGKSQFHKDAFENVINQEKMNAQRKSTKFNALQLYIDFKCSFSVSHNRLDMGKQLPRP